MDSKQLLPRAGKPHSHSWKNCKYHVHQSVVMKYCNCHDVTSIYGSCQAISPTTWDEARVYLATMNYGMYLHTS